METKKEFFELIQSNIHEYGYHVTIVTGGPQPRYAYTIGLIHKLGIELIFAGGLFYMKNELYEIFNSVVKEIQQHERTIDSKISTENLGDFALSNVDDSWSELMLLGVYDFYDLKNIKVFQIKPDSRHFTLDIPEMNTKFSTSLDKIWQWLNREWHYSVPENSDVVTNLIALQGSPITEIMRCEEDEWEMFSGSGPDVEKEDARVVPLGVLLGIDDSIHAALGLEIGKGLWRDRKGEKWNDWG
jgi:hypothetical protein